MATNKNKEHNPNQLPLHAGARSHLFANARKLRSESTVAEQVLWEKLRNRQFMGLKFRRQHPLKHFIVDFYCHELKLVVEADGGYHNEPEQKNLDKSRSQELERLGYTVLRFTNREIINHVNMILERLERVVKEIRQL